ncbi:MAG: Ig-like domain-containing protein [Gemmatimonadota bacterium]
MNSVTVTPAAASIEVGKTVNLVANVDADAGVGDLSVTWSTSDATVATVAATGPNSATVTGVAAGTAGITATSNFNTSKSGSAQVDVKAAVPPAEARLSIQGVRNVATGLPTNLNNVVGQVIVTLNVEQGDFEVDSVFLQFDGTDFQCQSIAPSPSIGIAAAVAAANAPEDVECFVDTAATVNQCTGVDFGTQLTAQFLNGLTVLGARLSLTDGSSVEAENEFDLTLNNPNVLQVVHDGTSGKGLIGANGRRYWGGETVNFGACPVAYDGKTVGTVQLRGDTDPNGDIDVDGSTVGTPDADADMDVDFGSGSGALHTDAASPWIFSAVSGGINIGVEDDFADGRFGHTIGGTRSMAGVVTSTPNTDFRVFAADGENLTTSFTGLPLTQFWLDLTGPRVNCSPCFGPPVASPSVITIAGAPIVAGAFYFGGAITVSSIDDLADPFGVLPRSFIQIDVEEPGVLPSITVADVGDMSDAVIPEDDAICAGGGAPGAGFGGPPGGTGADANAVDCYEAEVRKIEDFLGNTTSPTLIAANPDPAHFGKDIFPPVFSSPDPDDPTFVWNPDIFDATIPGAGQDEVISAAAGDEFIMFNLVDPLLGSGDSGSLVDDALCSSTIPGPAFSSFCTMITAASAIGDPLSIALPVDDLGTDEVFAAPPADWGVVIDALTGFDGSYNVTVFAQDNAIPGVTGNTSSFVFNFILDITAPDIKPFTQFPSDATIGGGADGQFDLAGSVTDANTINKVIIRIFIDNLVTPAACDAGDITLMTQGTAAGNVDDNTKTYDLTDGLPEDPEFSGSGGAVSFDADFTIVNPAATVTYCLIVDTEDNAQRKTDGPDPDSVGPDPNPNKATQFIQWTVTWS